MAANAESESGREDGGPRRPPPSRVKAPDCVLAMGARRRHNGGGWPREQTRCSAGGGGERCGPRGPPCSERPTAGGIWSQQNRGASARERRYARASRWEKRGGRVAVPPLSGPCVCARARHQRCGRQGVHRPHSARPLPSPLHRRQGGAGLPCVPHVAATKTASQQCTPAGAAAGHLRTVPTRLPTGAGVAERAEGDGGGR